MDTFQSEKQRIEDPRRLYAPGRLYHILYTQPCRYCLVADVLLSAIS